MHHELLAGTLLDLADCVEVEAHGPFLAARLEALAVDLAHGTTGAVAIAAASTGFSVISKVRLLSFGFIRLKP